MSQGAARAGRGRKIASILLAVAGSFFLFIGAFMFYAREKLLDPEALGDRATTALDDSQVRLALSQPITDAVIDNGPPQLINGRPLIESAVVGALGSPPVRDTFRESVQSATSKLFDRHPRGLLVNLADAALVASDAVSALSPEIGRQIPDAISSANVEVFESQVLVATLALAEDVRALGLILPFIGLALLGGSVLAAPERRHGMTRAAVAAAVPMVAGLALLLAGRAIVVNQFDGAVLRDAAGAVWDAMLGGLEVWMVAAAALFVIIAAAARFGEEPADVFAPARRSAAALARRPDSTWMQVLRAFVIGGLGLSMLLHPHVALAVLTVTAGVWALYVAVLELMAIIAPPISAKDRATARAERRPRLLAAGVAAAALVVVVVVIAVGGGGEEATARPPGAPEACNGYSELCDKRIDQVTIPATHNSMSAAAEPGWFAPNQRYGMVRQLDDGIRGLLIDTHYGAPRENASGRGFGEVITDLSRENTTREELVDQIGPAAVKRAESLIDDLAFDGTSRPSQPYLCHVLCELGATELTAGLRSIREWLDQHPDEFIVIVVEDVVTPKETIKAFEDAGLARYAWEPQRGQVPPTLGELIERDQRMLVMAERDGGGVRFPWYGEGYRDLLQETPYHFDSVAEIGEPASCRPNRGRAENPLLQINNWVEKLPRDPSLNARVNERRALLARARMCARRRGMQPNVIAVDNYDLGDVLGVAKTLNGIRPEKQPEVRDLG
jgi:hypothetical protein